MVVLWYNIITFKCKDWLHTMNSYQSSMFDYMETSDEKSRESLSLLICSLVLAALDLLLKALVVYAFFLPSGMKMRAKLIGQISENSHMVILQK